jgi:signal transduction histidine kinase
MRERALAIDGTLRIESGQKGGVRVELDVPLPENVP